ncbi:MAG: LCP family protein [Patescibacteria group bacterium]|nr:LCP family protein [Patescibacteria group bacterium]MDD4610885.1 LCP family protein [Patescibacteria group bacterium]
MINFNKEEFRERNYTSPQSGKKKKIKIAIWLSLFFIVTFVIFSGQAMISNKNKTESWVYKVPIIGQLKRLAESAGKDLKGENRDRINILLLGVGGKNHDGAWLTDTIILASIQPSTKRVSLLSIPRDMSVPIEGMGWRKINNVSSYAETANPGSGGLATSQAVSDVLDMPIDYYVRLDFEGFKNIIDDLGGIEVNVENTLEDYQYPILGMEDAEPYKSRFEHLYIEKGMQKMDGELALKYVRSRHASGIEGTDFARARRQQRVLESAKDKFLSKNTIFNPGIITDILSELENHVSTNLQIWEILKLWDLVKNVDKNEIINKVLDNSPSGLLVDTTGIDGAYLLTPRSGDFSEIQYLAKNIFSDAPAENKVAIKAEKAKVEVRNGTWINGLASRKAMDIEKYGFEVIRVGNSSRQNFEKSVIYDLSFGEKKDSLEILKEKIGANVTTELPDWLKEDIAKEAATQNDYEQPNFILILGQDADTTESGMQNPER